MFKQSLLASVLASAMALASFNAAAASVTYKLDAQHTNVIASWSHFGYSYPSANFSDASGLLVFDADAPEKSSVEVSLPMSGLDTFVPALNDVLKTAEFFDAGTFAASTFKSTKVQVVGVDMFEVTGLLTIKGVSKPATLHVTLNKAAVHPMTKLQTIGFNATATIKRSDFGMGMYAPAVSDEISLRITTEAVVPAAKAATP